MATLQDFGRILSTKDESIDLIYLDPPFNSSATYNVLFKAPSGEGSQAQIEAFEDTWHWNESAERAFDEVVTGPHSDAGVMQARIRDNEPEVDLQPPSDLRPDAAISRHLGELRMGFVNTGVPHLVVRTDDTGVLDLSSRGPELRYHESLAAGANVNWVAPDRRGGWLMRTYERGVEAETLACGTGAVACAVMLGEWGEAGQITELRTRSGKTLTVTVRTGPSGLAPSLAGEGRIVFEGNLRDI